MKILAVDDDKTALEILELSLDAAGYDEIDLAQSAADAVTLIQSAKTPYDCMLFDINMPNTGGIDLCRLVRQIPEYFGIPIIMITAVENKDILKQAIQAGATDYVHKPFDGIELGTRLRAASILAEAVKTADYNNLGHTPSDDDGLSDLKFSDAFSLEPKIGLINQSELWYDLVERDPLPDRVQMFAMSIGGASSIFRTVSNALFRIFINEVAHSIAQITKLWEPRISYIGNGTFIVVLLEAEDFTIEKAQSVISTSLVERPFKSLSIYKGRLRFCFEHVLNDTIANRSSANALCALLQAGADAHRAASDYRSVEQQRELRLRFLGRGEPKPITTWETTWAKPARRVKPKRIVPQNGTQQNREDGGFDRNIFNKF